MKSSQFSMLIANLFIVGSFLIEDVIKVFLMLLVATVWVIASVHLSSIEHKIARMKFRLQRNIELRKYKMKIEGEDDKPTVKRRKSRYKK